MNRRNKVNRLIALFVITAVLSAYLGYGNWLRAEATLAQAGAGTACSFPTLPFPTPLSPNMPYDVDMAKKKQLENQQQFGQVQRLFDILAWQTFIALNWPVNQNGVPERSLDSSSPHLWETWAEVFQVYKEDGSEPGKWGSRTTPPGLDVKPGDRVLRMPFKNNIVNNTAHATVADETLQAFSGPLVDQNGKWVRYEVLLNEVEFNYVVENKFYNLEGQLAFSQQNKVVNFPSGRNKAGLNRPPLPNPQRGAMELKLAWKEIGQGDIKERFLTEQAWVQNSTTKQWEKKLMGLVGMHIAIKTESAPTWIWATFEQMDNVRVNDLLAGTPGHPQGPSFNDPNQPTKPVNVLPTPTNPDGSWDEAKVTTPVQVARVIPIPQSKEMLNCEVQNLLKNAKSVLQYYELIDTQWPTGTDPKTGTIPLAPAIPGGSALPYNAPNSVSNKAPGNITPVFLTNSTMETYFQAGNQPATQQEEGSSLDNKPVFATESCTGCHYSAGIAIASYVDASGNKQAIFGAAGNGDFSWLMAQKAHWRNPKGK